MLAAKHGLSLPFWLYGFPHTIPISTISEFVGIDSSLKGGILVEREKEGDGIFGGCWGCSKPECVALQTD